MVRARWQVMTDTLYGYDNLWAEDGEQLTFRTRHEAQEALDVHVDMMRGAGCARDESLHYMITNGTSTFNVIYPSQN